MTKIRSPRGLLLLFAVYLLAAVCPGTALANSCHAVFSEEAHAMRFMTERKIQYAERVPGMFEVLPEGEHPMNRFAARVKTVYGAVVMFSPKLLNEAGATAFVMPFSQPDGTKIPGLFIARKTLYEERRPLRDPVNLHELRHLKFNADRKAGKNSPFHGTVAAVRGEIPDGLSPMNPYYRHYMSFEELKTFSDQTKNSLTAVRGALRAPEPKQKRFQEAMEEFTESAGALIMLSTRVENLMTALERIIANDPSRAVFETRDGLLHAVTKDITAPEASLEVAVPLVEAGRPGADLPALYASQRKILRDAALERMQLYELIGETYQRIMDPSNGTEAKIAAVDELQRALGRIDR